MVQVFVFPDRHDVLLLGGPLFGLNPNTTLNFIYLTGLFFHSLGPPV